MTKPTVLVLGDPDLPRMLSRHFDATYTVQTIPHTPTALLFNVTPQPDLILLAVPPAWGNPALYLQELRRVLHCPVVIVTTDSSASARIEALRSGADDYVCRPVDYRELAARLDTILRRISISLMDHQSR